MKFNVYEIEIYDPETKDRKKVKSFGTTKSGAIDKMQERYFFAGGRGESKKAYFGSSVEIVSQPVIVARGLPLEEANRMCQ